MHASDAVAAMTASKSGVGVPPNCHVEPAETSSRKAHIFLFATLDSSTTLLATSMLMHRTYGFAFFKGVAM